MQGRISLQDEVERVFGRGAHIDVEQGRRISMEEGLTVSPVRSLAWMVFLGVVAGGEEAAWGKQAAGWRRKYARMKKRLTVKPEAEASEADNPLASSADSAWSQYFADEELRADIKRDLTRTYPDMPFFHADDIQALLLDALFVYSKNYPDPSYRQGMHELLAPIVYVLHLNRARSAVDVPDWLAPLYDPALDAIEADAYQMFHVVMHTAREWYAVTNVPRGTIAPPSPLIIKCQAIQDAQLRAVDPELTAHLVELGIEPQLYALRWVRLLFGREFHLDDVVILWDGLFAHSPTLDLVDHVCVALLLYLRNQLLTSDYVSALRRVMTFPPVEDVRCFIEQARVLADGRSPLRTRSASDAAAAAAASAAASAATASEYDPLSGGSHSRGGASSFVTSLIGTVTAPVAALSDAAAPRRRRRKRDAPPPGASTSSELARVSAHVEDLLNTNYEMGSKLADIVAVLEGEVHTSHPPDREQLYLAIAAVKQIKDVLLGNLPYSLDDPVPIAVPAPRNDVSYSDVLHPAGAELEMDDRLPAPSPPSPPPPGHPTPPSPPPSADPDPAPPLAHDPVPDPVPDPAPAPAPAPVPDPAPEPPAPPPAIDPNQVLADLLGDDGDTPKRRAVASLFGDDDDDFDSPFDF